MNDIEKSVLVRFLEDCGGVQFVRAIASGFDLGKSQKIVAAAKAAVCAIEQH